MAVLTIHYPDIFILFYKISYWMQSSSFYFARSVFGCSRLHFILQNQLLDVVVFILFYKILYWADAELQP